MDLLSPAVILQPSTHKSDALLTELPGHLSPGQPRTIQSSRSIANIWSEPYFSSLHLFASSIHNAAIARHVEWHQSMKFHTLSNSSHMYIGLYSHQDRLPPSSWLIYQRLWCKSYLIVNWRVDNLNQIFWDWNKIAVACVTVWRCIMFFS